MMLAASGFALWLWQGFYAPGKARRNAVVEVTAGASVAQVARVLQERGLIRSALAFRVGAHLTGDSARIKQGEYALVGTMSPRRILRTLVSGRSIRHRLTVPEGSSVLRIAELLEQRGLSDPDGFRKLAMHGAADFDTSFPKPADSLEGYLFPDTYHLDRHLPPGRLVSRMLDRFDEKIWRGVMDRGRNLRGKSLHDIITLASLVEGEARRREERETIAGVLWNRLNQGRPLQCDATVQYALGDHKARLTFDDLRVESPYNTYLHTGLPPGPISNPGLASIEAALNPAQVPYLYYVARADGRHIFTRTYAEHQAAIKRLAALGER